ncbi:hypothetical protein ES703_114597 [subsurface metagenome]
MASARAIISRVVPIISGLTETEVMPQATSFWVSSGYTEGACPLMDEVTPMLFDTLMALSRATSTASSRSSKVWASLALSRSMPRISWVRSLEPIDMPSRPTSRNFSMRRILDGTSTIIHSLKSLERFRPSCFRIFTVCLSSLTVRTKGIITHRFL